MGLAIDGAMDQPPTSSTAVNFETTALSIIEMTPGMTVDNPDLAVLYAGLAAQLPAFRGFVAALRSDAASRSDYLTRPSASTLQALHSAIAAIQGHLGSLWRGSSADNATRIAPSAASTAHSTIQLSSYRSRATGRSCFLTPILETGPDGVCWRKPAYDATQQLWRLSGTNAIPRWSVIDTIDAPGSPHLAALIPGKSYAIPGVGQLLYDIAESAALGAIYDAPVNVAKGLWNAGVSLLDDNNSEDKWGYNPGMMTRIVDKLHSYVADAKVDIRLRMPQKGGRFAVWGIGPQVTQSSAAGKLARPDRMALLVSVAATAFMEFALPVVAVADDQVSALIAKVAGDKDTLSYLTDVVADLSPDVLALVAQMQHSRSLSEQMKELGKVFKTVALSILSHAISDAPLLRVVGRYTEQLASNEARKPLREAFNVVEKSTGILELVDSAVGTINIFATEATFADSWKKNLFSQSALYDIPREPSTPQSTVPGQPVTTTTYGGQSSARCPSSLAAGRTNRDCVIPAHRNLAMAMNVAKGDRLSLHIVSAGTNTLEASVRGDLDGCYSSRNYLSWVDMTCTAERSQQVELRLENLEPHPLNADVYAQRMNNPRGCATVEFGQVSGGALTRDTPVMCFRVPVQPGAMKVDGKIVEAGIGPHLQMIGFDANGDKAGDWDADYLGKLQANFTVTQPGVSTVLVESWGEFTAAFTLRVSRAT
jgi:hypothetical protein